MKALGMNDPMMEIRARIAEAMRNDDTEAYMQACEDMISEKSREILEDYQESLRQMQEQRDDEILSQRGVRRLTSEERGFYGALQAALRSRDVKQALSNLDKALPMTVINAVFEDLRTQHPLLSHIRFEPSAGLTRVLVNALDAGKAGWSALTGSVSTQADGGIGWIDLAMLKLSAYVNVPNPYLDMGPEWLDRLVRETLYEYLANGLEDGIINGNGNGAPIGMIRQVGEGVSVVGGVYPAKDKISVTDFSPTSMGNMLSLLALDAYGKARILNDLILVVNAQDYYKLVFPATTIQAPDGTYRRDVFPYPLTVVPSVFCPVNEAVFGAGGYYVAAAGMAAEGVIDESDHAAFLDDAKSFRIKLYANGQPKDANSFLYLDISGLQATPWKVVEVDAKTPSSNAKLSALRLGGLTIAFDADTTSYTVATTDTANMIYAAPADAGATMVIKLGTTVKQNGTELTWAAGSNTVTVKVTAEDGTTTKTYTATVTKS